jgi:hypothetical protein
MRISLPVVVGVVIGLAGAGMCAASTAEYQVISTDLAGDAVDATATFVLDSSGDLTLILSNEENGIKDVGQAITQIKFNLSDLTGSAHTSSQTGDNVTVNTKTSLTDDGTGTLLNLWTASTSLPTVTLSALGNGQPQSSILGPETSGEYPDANGSIAGNSGHNPFVDTTATFTFTGLGGLAGANINSILSSVFINFGTAAGGDYIQGTFVATPEPGTIGLCLGGLGLLLAGWRRRRA